VELLSTSVDELWKQVLPPGTDLLAGEASLLREVTWASSLRVRPPAFPKLAQGEMALLSTEWLELIDPPLHLAQVIEGLAQRGVSAVAVTGTVPGDAIHLSEGLGMPLLRIPQGSNLYELEGAIVRFISSQRALLHQKGGEIYRRLMETSIQGQGMPGLLRALAQSTGKASALLDQRFRPRHLTAPPGVEITIERLGSALREAGAPQLETLRQLAGRPEPPVLDLPELLPGFQVVGCPIFLREEISGYLLLAGPTGEIGPLERLVLSQASNVFASEMAKERAVIAAESRLKGDFLEELLEGDLEDEGEVASRASYLGYDLSGPRVVVTLRMETDQRSVSHGEATPEAIMQRLHGVFPEGAAAMARGQEVILLLPLSGLNEKVDLVATAENLRHNVARALGGVTVVAGIGRYHPGLRGLQRSFQEARHAVLLGCDMAPGVRTHFFGNLGVYPVLSPLLGTPEAEAFLDETLGPLLMYDRRNNAELVRTLDAYFANQENLGKTADALHLHRNSLSYRLHRIAEVSSVSLDDAEVRFRLQLALKLRRLLNHRHLCAGRPSKP